MNKEDHTLGNALRTWVLQPVVTKELSSLLLITAHVREYCLFGRQTDRDVCIAPYSRIYLMCCWEILPVVVVFYCNIQCSSVFTIKMLCGKLIYYFGAWFKTVNMHKTEHYSWYCSGNCWKTHRLYLLDTRFHIHWNISLCSAYRQHRTTVLRRHSPMPLLTLSVKSHFWRNVFEYVMQLVLR